jgi:hypothetical protein
MYTGDNAAYPGSYSPSDDAYVWMVRIAPNVANNRLIFSCPAAAPDSAWDTNANNTLGSTVGTTPVPGYAQGQYDPWLVTPNSRFSVAYNDWGLGQATGGQALAALKVPWDSGETLMEGLPTVRLKTPESWHRRK